MFPVFNTSTLSFSSLPLGTSTCGILGILDSKLSNSVFIFFCESVNLSNSNVSSLDFLNKVSSLDFEISFFSFSIASFF